MKRQVRKKNIYKKCDRCGTNVKEHNKFFFRCGNCALLKQKEGVIIKW